MCDSNGRGARIEHSCKLSHSWLKEVVYLFCMNAERQPQSSCPGGECAGNEQPLLNARILSNSTTINCGNTRGGDGCRRRNAMNERSAEGGRRKRSDDVMDGRMKEERWWWTGRQVRRDLCHSCHIYWLHHNTRSLRCPLSFNLCTEMGSTFTSYQHLIRTQLCTCRYTSPPTRRRRCLIPHCALSQTQWQESGWLHVQGWGKD